MYVFQGPSPGRRGHTMTTTKPDTPNHNDKDNDHDPNPMTALVVGIDPHKRNLTYVAQQGQTELDHGIEAPATKTTLRNLAQEYPDAVFLLEACGPHTWMHDQLKENDCTVHVTQPPSRDPNEDKHDLADARRLIQRYQLDDLRPVHTPTPSERMRRDVNRKRKLLVEKRQDLRNSIEDTLARIGYFAQPPHPNPFTQDGRQHAVETVPHLEALYEAVTELDEQIEALTTEVKEHAREDPHQEHLESIPGVGLLTGQALSAELQDPHRFDTSDQVVSYIGLDPDWEESAGTRKDLHRISKQGPGYVRGLLVQAAWSHVRRCPESSLTHAYHGKAGEKGDQVAIVMLARKLLKVAWTLMLEERAFIVEGPPPGSRAAAVGPVADADAVPVES